MTQTNPASVEIIAELAQGFEGKPEQASLMVKAAAKAGADAVKFQLVYCDELATPEYAYYDLFKSLEMDDSVWQRLADEAESFGIELHVDIFGEKSLKLAEKLNLTSVKLHGTDISNLGFLEKVAASSVPRVFLGAGGAHQNEIDTALEILSSKEVIVLLGFQAYPTPTETNQIGRVSKLIALYEKSDKSVAVGFADHASPEDDLKFALAASAIGAGARVIEKHLTLGKIMELEDHESALNPDEFSTFCATIRACVLATDGGTDDDNFGMSGSEISYREMIRRHVVAKKDLAAGTVLSPQDVELKRSASDVPIYDITSVYGRELKSAIDANAPVLESDLK